MPGKYASYSSCPWHHCFATGAPSLLALLLPFVMLVLLLLVLSVAGWGERQVGSFRNKRMARAAQKQAVAEAAQAGPVLASDVERDETARRVSVAVGEGRLSFEEGGERIESALRSRHQSELAALVADLPAQPTSTPSGRAPATPRRLLLLSVAALIVLAAGILQAVAGLWELWPLGVIALGAPALPARTPSARTLPARKSLADQ